jgi:hypothetical protein
VIPQFDPEVGVEFVGRISDEEDRQMMVRTKL